MNSGQKRKALPLIIAGAWLLTVGLGLHLIWAYAATPGNAGKPPSHWPVDSRVPHSASVPTLVMMIHPHCPCSRASLDELEILMAKARGRVQATVIFVKPTDLPPHWEKTDLWKRAANIPGVTVSTDDGGVEAHRFSSYTSGQVMLYDEPGQLLFNGGITSARGHSGNNAGRNTVLSLLLDKAAGNEKT